MMSGKQRKTNKKKPHPRGKAAVQLVPPVLPSSAPVSSKFHLSIDWKRVNFPQFIIILAMFLFILLYIIIPTLNSANWLRPHIYITAQIIGGSLIAAATFLSAGIVKVQGVKLWQKPKLKQVLYSLIISICTMLIILVIIVQPPNISANSQLEAIPYPPFKGELVINGMQSTPSKDYSYWKSSTDKYGSCQFVGTNYRVTANNQKGLEICPAINTSFHNFAFEIDMTFLKPGDAGILFEATDEVAYQLTIASFGNYARLSLDVLSGFDTQEPTIRGLIEPMPIVAKDQGPVLFAPGYTNRIAVVVNNQTIIPYVNGLTTSAWKRHDDSSSQGGIALEAFNSQDGQSTQTEVVFSNVRAWEL